MHSSVGNLPAYTLLSAVGIDRRNSLSLTGSTMADKTVTELQAEV